MKIFGFLLFVFLFFKNSEAQNYLVIQDSVGFVVVLKDQTILKYQPLISTDPCRFEIKLEKKYFVICEKITGYFGKKLQIHIFHLNPYNSSKILYEYFGETELIGIDWIDKEVKIEISRKKIGIKVGKKLIFLRYLEELSHTPNQKWLR